LMCSSRTPCLVNLWTMSVDVFSLKPRSVFADRLPAATPELPGAGPVAPRTSDDITRPSSPAAGLGRRAARFTRTKCDGHILCSRFLSGRFEQCEYSFGSEALGGTGPRLEGSVHLRYNEGSGPGSHTGFSFLKINENRTLRFKLHPFRSFNT